MNSKTVSASPQTVDKSGTPLAARKIGRFFERIVHPFLEAFFPKPRYLEGEEVKQVIQMAEYRAELPKLVGALGLIILVPALIVFFVLYASHSDTGQVVAAVFVIAALLLILESAQGLLLYNQWQFIVTNKRFILITPHPERRGFADVIYLKGGKIQVLDTNFSRSPVWGLFQALLGSRDVMLSMSGYEFKETGAQVKGGLRFPDVKAEDIKRLEELIFG